MPRLIVESGGERREIVLSDLCRIGRDGENDLVLNDSGASRRHCRIARDGEAWIVEDLHSANGTHKNEERIDRARLTDGDKVRIGGTTLTFVAGDVLSHGSSGFDDEIKLEDPAETHARPAVAPARAGGPPASTPASSGAASPDAASKGAAAWRLIGVTGEVAGKRFDVKPPRLTIGRKGTNGIGLNDSKVSGVHCEVVFEGGRPVLRDLGSTNGTFLEGKRIDEIALSHGDRFGLGECVFVVADVSQPEPELERTDDESERTIIQVPGFRKTEEQATAVSAEKVEAVTRRGGSLLGMLGVLIVVGGIAAAGWYAMELRGKAKGVASAPPAANNLLGDRWSFESTETVPSPAAMWDLAAAAGIVSASPAASGPASGSDNGDESESTGVRIDDFDIATGKGHSGESSLRCRLSGSGGVALLRDPLPSANRRYAVSGFARTSGDATALLAVEFLRADDPTYRLAAVVASGRGSDWTKLEGSIVAPSGADQLRLALVAAGGDGGEVSFDDLSISSESSERPSAKQVGAFEFEGFGDALLVRRNPETLARVLPPIVTMPDGSRYDAGLFHDGGTLRAGNGTTAEVKVEFQPETRKGVLAVNAAADASRVGSVVLPVELVGGVLDHDVNVLSDSRGLEPYRDSFEVDGASAIVVGKGATRMRLTLTPAVHLKAVRDERRFALEFSIPAGAGQLTIDTQVDFVAEIVDAARAKDDAEAAFRRGALGETSAKLQAIRESYAFDENAMAAAEALRQSVELETEKVKKGAAAAAERARYLRSEPSYREAIAIANDAAQRLAGLKDAADQVKADAERLALENDLLVAERRKVEAARLLARQGTALAQQPKKLRIAREIAEHLEREFPGSEAAVTAKQNLEQAQSTQGGK